MGSIVTVLNSTPCTGDVQAPLKKNSQWKVAEACYLPPEFLYDSSCSVHVMRTSVILPRSRDEIFAFFSDAFQLQRLTPEWVNFGILTPAPILIREGCLIDYKLRIHGIPVRWRTEISSWNPPFAFTDRQLKGPYSLWEHRHIFEEVPGGTLMHDIVRYRSPGGRLLNWLFVENDVRRIFEFRALKMIELFPAIEDSAISAASAK
ncbi:MAG: SRPBCC family protein [Planctomyces sp.]|jgi:ligand-binding SRPBCC domain-containing protein